MGRTLKPNTRSRRPTLPAQLSNRHPQHRHECSGIGARPACFHGRFNDGSALSLDLAPMAKHGSARLSACDVTSAAVQQNTRMEYLQCS